MGKWRSHIKCFACMNRNICPFHHKTCWRKSPESSKSSRGPKDIIIKSNYHYNNFIGYRSVYVASKLKDDGHATCQATTLLLWLPPEAATQHDNIRLQISEYFWKHFQEILIPMIFWIDIYIYICVILNIYVFITTPPLRVVVICRSECPCHMFHMFSHFSPSWKGSKRFKSPWSSKKTLAAAALRSDESRGKIIRFKFHQSISRSMQYAIANVFGEKNMWSLLMSHLSFLFQICFMFNLCAEILPYYTSLTWHSNV